MFLFPPWGERNLWSAIETDVHNDKSRFPKKIYFLFFSYWNFLKIYSVHWNSLYYKSVVIFKIEFPSSRINFRFLHLENLHFKRIRKIRRYHFEAVDLESKLKSFRKRPRDFFYPDERWQHPSLAKPFFCFPYFASCSPRLRHLIFIPPLPRAVQYDARGHGRSHRAKLEKWTTLLIKYEKQFLSVLIPPRPSPPPTFPVHVTSATLWVARIPLLTSKSQIGRNATLQRYIAPGVWAAARSSRPLNLSLRNSLETTARTDTTHGIAKTESDPLPSLCHYFTH